MVEDYISKELISSIISEICNFTYDKFRIDKFNSDYEGFTFEINKTSFKSRLARKTQKKKGYFVSFWCKNEHNENIPLDYTTIENKLIINIIDDGKLGQFIFPKDILKDKNIVKSDKSEGKMAMRVYPSWISDLNTTAKSAQSWQVKYFVNLTNDFNRDNLYSLYFH